MNNHFIYGAIGFIVGALAGGFLMGCVCAKSYKKTIEELQSDNDMLRHKTRNEKEEEIAKRQKKVEEHKLAKMTAEEIVGYSKYVASGRGETGDEGDDDEFDSEENVDFDDPFEDEDEDTDEREMIRLITKTAYNEDLQYRDSETLTYYVTDGILADAFDDPVTNIAEVIGVEAIEKAETTSDDEIYVSNDIEDKVYEIVIEHDESYYKDLAR